MRVGRTLAAFAFALIAGSGLATAGESSGVIVSVDADTRSVTLDSGETFIVKDLVDRLVLKVGQRVRITHEPTREGLNAASIVVPQG